MSLEEETSAAIKRIKENKQERRIVAEEGERSALPMDVGRAVSMRKSERMEWRASNGMARKGSDVCAWVYPCMSL